MWQDPTVLGWAKSLTGASHLKGPKSSQNSSEKYPKLGELVNQFLGRAGTQVGADPVPEASEGRGPKGDRPGLPSGGDKGKALRLFHN